MLKKDEQRRWWGGGCRRRRRLGNGGGSGAAAVDVGAKGSTLKHDLVGPRVIERLKEVMIQCCLFWLFRDVFDRMN